MKPFCLGALFVLFFQFLPMESYGAKSNSFSIEKDRIKTIESKKLRIALDADFPRIIQYNWIANGTVFRLKFTLLLPDQDETTTNGVIASPSTSIQNATTAMTWTFREVQRTVSDLDS